MEKMRLFDRDTIAGAVAREIQRREFTPTKQIEGLAYKAAFDRMGSAAEKHIDAFAADAQLMKANILSGRFQQCEKCGAVYHNKYGDVFKGAHICAGE